MSPELYEDYDGLMKCAICYIGNCYHEGPCVTNGCKCKRGGNDRASIHDPLPTLSGGVL